MQYKKIVMSLLTGLSCTTSFAAPYILVAPNCLLNKDISYQTLSSNKQFSLIKVDKTGLNQLIKAKSQQKKPCGGFMNVTASYQNKTTFLNDFLRPMPMLTTNNNFQIRYSQTVNHLLPMLTPQNMWTDLTTLSHFEDRYAGSNNGVNTANWLKKTMEDLAKTNHRTDVKAYFVKTGDDYIQPSLVVKIGDSSEPGIVIGAHMDTLESSMWSGNMPGADDDGSGSVTTLEVARTLLNSGIHFKKPIYFIWYSAEEEGLVGSQYVVADFKAKHIPVDAVIHMDMTGYANKNDPTIWLVRDNTNPELSSFLETLTNTYVKKPVKYTACGYACSDHATWTKNGYKAAIPFEAEFGKDDPYIHTSEDTMNVLSLDHMTDFAKLGMAFVVELAEPTA
jgi:leucyl aminopeptidase